MATPDKNTNLKPYEKYFIGKGTLEFLPLRQFKIPKKGTPIDHFHFNHKYPKNTFNVECNPEGICPICEMLKPKTKWQKIKLWFSNKWRQLRQEIII